ncbi:signal peptidase II [Methylobacterium sp. 10]|uniref:signal peptidase II n=1 Tax=Methylobacterium sp. 10 TaxID=1101191 RepID=UPI000486E142|nr:signal peptidase II [Methylobacterium sp. 10]
MPPFRLGLLILLATLVLDQASKLWLYFGTDLVLTQPWHLTAFADVVVVWNRGISYGLFQQDGGLGRWILVAVSVAASIGMIAWMHRASSLLLAAALGLIAGGAIGNAIDRAAYGAVFDFVHLHAGAWSWYVFNIADAAIVAGVVGLLIDSLIPMRRPRDEAPPSGP